jgi:hypothetical protein
MSGRGASCHSFVARPHHRFAGFAVEILSKENGRETIISVAALPCRGDFIFVRMFSRKRLTDF